MRPSPHRAADARRSPTHTPWFGVGLGASGATAPRQLAAALRALDARPGLSVCGQSALYQNPAVGGATQALFVNAAAVVCTTRSPEWLLTELRLVEAQHGRIRLQKNGPRTLDLDVLYAGGGPCSHVWHSPRLTLPHPRVAGRPFALVPLAEALRHARLPVPPQLSAALRALPPPHHLVRQPLPS